MDYIDRNIRVYKWYTLFSELLILGPILTIYLLSKDLTFTQITILQAIYSLTIVLFEVPTGAIADKISRKLSLSLGCIFGIAGLAIYIVGQGFWIYVLAEVAFSMSRCLKSGADTALIYDSLTSANRQDEYQMIEGVAKQYMFYGQGIGAVVASVVYSINRELPLIISMINFFIALIISLFFIEDKMKHDKHGGYYSHIASSYKYIVNHDKVKSIILYSTLLSVFLRVGFWYYQPYMVEVDISVIYFGALFLLFNLVAAQAAKNNGLFIRMTKSRTLITMSCMVVVSYFILGITKAWIGVFIILFQQAVRGMAIPITRKYMNKHIEGNQRATILSFNSLASNLIIVFVLPIAGWLVDNTDIFTSHIILGAIMLIMTFLINVYTKDKLIKKFNN